MQTAVRVFILLSAVLAFGVHAAEPFPAKPLHLIVPFAPGGPIDQTARPLAQKLGEALGQPVVVENRTGANGIIAAEAVARAPADGYTLLFSVIHHTVLPSLNTKLSYDIEKDFAPVTLAAVYPIIVVVNPSSLPVSSIQELISRAKASPGKLSYGHSGYGGGTHLAGELFKMQAGVDLLQVPYKGSAPAMADLLGGQVNVMFSDAPTAMGHIKSGRIRPLGISTPKRSSLLPNVPTIIEAGLPDYDAYSWGGVSVPAATPADVVTRLNADIVKVLRDPAMKDRLFQIGAEPMAGTPAEYAAHIKREIAKWAKVVKQANIKIE
jgi:tripartite-type tricarboxylate transporter receptor subunit TctC